MNVPHGGYALMEKLKCLASPMGLTSPIHHLEVHPSHGHYPPTTQVHVENLKI
jgi:hypothetical protein